MRLLTSLRCIISISILISQFSHPFVIAEQSLDAFCLAMLCDTKFEKMEGQSKRFVRFETSIELMDMRTGKPSFDSESLERTPSSLSKSLRRKWEKGSQSLRNFGRSLRFGTSRVYSEEYEPKKRKIWDPRDKLVQRWNKIFVVSCLVAVSVDPLFFYLPVISDDICLKIEICLAVLVTILRTITDIFYVLHMILHFRTGYIAPSSRVLGRGELVIDPWHIAKRYLAGDFGLDLVAVLPLPQVVIWFVIPALGGPAADKTKTALRFIIFFQYLPRLYRIYPLTQEIVKATGVVMETAWAGAAYNLLLYMLASHVLGASWYLFAIERVVTCWHKACELDRRCILDYLDCESLSKLNRNSWLKYSNITASCTSGSSFFNFGIYNDALSNHIISAGTNFVDKYFYCFWWGLRNLSTLGQGLTTSSYLGEVVFSIALAILGLILFAHLIGNMQTYLQSLTVRLEEMRLKRSDTEQWMRHRQLPPDLREQVQRYEQYKWLETRGVDEEALVKSLPKDLRRDIKRHLCLKLVQGVPLFSSMDNQLLDAICERLQPTLFTAGTDIVREGDPVNEMLFVIRGHLKSQTTDGGRTGFLNVGVLKPGDFCGEELLTWALDPKSGGSLPSSTRSVTATTEVEAFALKSEDIKFVASQFRRLHSKQVQHTFRHYSQQWRTWAACFIQVAWRRHKKRRLAEAYNTTDENNFPGTVLESESLERTSLGATLYVSRFAANVMRGIHRFRKYQGSEVGTAVLKLQKPAEPDFSAEAE